MKNNKNNMNLNKTLDLDGKINIALDSKMNQPMDTLTNNYFNTNNTNNIYNNNLITAVKYDSNNIPENR